MVASTAVEPADHELLQAWRDGDRRAGATLFERHFDAIARFFRGKLGDDVQDLVQRTFLDLVESRARVDPNASVRAYLFGIARHRLVDHLRAQATREVDPAVTSLAELATSPSAALARLDEQRLLQVALRQLPIEQQMTLELAYWEGLRGAEIATAMGIGANTVRSRLARARDALRELLLRLEADAGLVAALTQDVERRSREFDHEQ
jgi:RNA polymerase sigma-70 factor (ECF subfamily)